jgi:hypothetical protein
MAGELVLRSLRLTKDEDQELRRLAWEAKVPIGELIRAPLLRGSVIGKQTLPTACW